MTDYLIKNARLVNEGDLLARGQWIERIDSGVPVPPGVEVADAAGLALLPGMIDDQVHFRDPGLTHKADMVTESRAAIAGGITSVMDMPNTNPQTVTLEALEQKFRHAEGRCHTNFAFISETPTTTRTRYAACAPTRPAASRYSWGQPPVTCWWTIPRCSRSSFAMRRHCSRRTARTRR